MQSEQASEVRFDSIEKYFRKIADGKVIGILPIRPELLTFSNWSLGAETGPIVYEKAIKDIRVHEILSPRRVEVIVNSSSGLGDRKVGERLGITENTVGRHLSETRNKILNLGYNFPTEIFNLYLLCLGTGKIDLNGNILTTKEQNQSPQ